MAHHHRHRREANPEPLRTVVSIIYHTLTPTFSGPVAGYSTDMGEHSTTASPITTTYEVVATLDGQTVSWEETQTLGAATATTADDASATAKKTGPTSIVVSTAIVSPTPSETAITVDTSAIVKNPSTTLASSLTSVLVASSTLHTITAAANTAASSSATAMADGSSNSKGLSSGAKAGIAIAVIAIFAAGIGIFWFFGCRKQRKGRKQLEEKDAYSRNDILAAKRTPTSTIPPQLHALRPVTQFSPNLGGNAESGSPWGVSERAGDQSASAWGNNNMGGQLSKENPFGTHAAAASNEHDEANPFGNHAVTAEGARVLEGAAAGGAAGATARRSSLDGATARRSSLDLSQSMTSGSSTSPGTSIDTAAICNLPGPGKKPAPVHRVQMEYTKTMEDELTVIPGVLVRLISEYDDGWCYVIRLDGGARGVCPRSCLSIQPIKPRSRGPQQPGRPMTPQGRSMTPTQGRPMTPNQAHQSLSTTLGGSAMGNSPVRPMTPGQARPMTPSSGGQPSPMSARRPQSPAMNQGRRPQSPAMNQGRPSSPAAMMQAPRPMTPTTGTSKALPMSPGASSGGENQGASKNGPGSSPLNTSVSEDQAFSASDESSSAFVTSPANSPPKSQIPLPTAYNGTVGRKPVPGQAL